MEIRNSVAETLGIKETKKWTIWYVFECPVKRCKRTIEATVAGYVEKNAIRHLEAHRNRQRKAQAALQDARTVKQLALASE